MITVIIPVHNEEDNIIELLQEVKAAAENTPISEVIVVDDASTDRSLALLKSARDDFSFLRVIKHEVCTGQSAAFMTAARAAGNNILVFMDGDRQNDPKDVRLLYKTYQDNISKNPKIMVAGQREKRQDNLLRRLSSRWANKIRSSFLKDGTRDTGCSLKLIRREDYIRLPYFKHMHRFLPALLMRDSVKILHVDVSHRPRVAGQSKYGFWNRFWVGITDLIGVKWLLIRGLPQGFAYHEIIQNEDQDEEKVVFYERRNTMA